MSISYRFTSEHFQFWMLHISVNSSLPVKFQFLRQLQLLLHSSSDGVNFDLLCQNPSWVDRHRVTAVALMQQMMSSSWGWHPDRDHRIQPDKLQRSGATNKVKFLYLSSCSSAFSAAEDKEIIEKISILTLPEVAFYRSMDKWMDISLARLDSVPILSETFSTKVAEIFLAQDCSLMSAWSSLLNDKHEWQFGNGVWRIPNQTQIPVPVYRRFNMALCW